MKRFAALTITTLALLSACTNTTAAPATTTAVTTTTPAPTTTIATTTTLPPTTLAPVTTKVPKPSTTSSTTQAPVTPRSPDQVAASTATSLQSAFGKGDFAPAYKTIWDKVKAAGGTIRVSGSNASDPSNPTRPQAAGAYAVSVGGSTYCIKMVMNEETLRAEYVTLSGVC